MGVFAWLRRRGKDDGQAPSGAAADAGAGAPAEPGRAEPGREGDAVEIPKQTGAPEAAGQEAGEGARP
jgi:hypothetical protein